MNDEPVAEQETAVVPPSAEVLQELVEHLYPEPSVVDVLTLDQFVFRYKFSGLGATAVADMERAQRITRSVGDHGQIGLAEYHIGLIYLHWGQFLGAIKYFDDALRHWQFVKNDSASSLALYAQGVCQHHAYHYEQALVTYGKVQRTLTRVEANGSRPPAAFLSDIKALLNKSREDVVQKIRTLGEGEPMPVRVPVTRADGLSVAATDEQPTPAILNDVAMHRSIVSPDAASRLPVAPLPISNLPHISDGESDTKPDMTGSEPGVVPVMLTKSPVPQHTNQSGFFIWYHVADREDLEEFLPSIQADTALLVDTRTDLYTCTEGDLVIVDQADAEGSIPLKPQQEIAGPPVPKVYLAEVDEQFSFERNPETGEIMFQADHPEEVGKVKIAANQADFPIYAEEIIGIVIGIWSKLHPAQK